MRADYFYSDERKRENFIMMPKELFKEERFSSLSLEAKNLYCLMLDRMSLSAKNELKDEENRIYIFFTLKNAMELLKVGKTKCVRIFAELISAGLIERKKLGQGRASMIYVKNVFPPENDEEVSKENIKKSQNETSRGSENEPLEVHKTNLNNNNINKTEINKTESNNHPIFSYHENIKRRDEMIRREKTAAEIKENIEYDVLKERYSKEKLSSIVDIITDCVCSDNEFFFIGKERLPSPLVKKRMMMLNSLHIEYVFDCLSKNTSNVKNIKSYLVSTLYNAPQTMEFYYDMCVARDLYG